MKGEYIGRIQGLYKMEFIWVQEEETGIGKVDTEYRKWITVPENSDVKWYMELEIIVKISIVCTLITKSLYI